MDGGALRDGAEDPEDMVRLGERDDSWADRARKGDGVEEDVVVPLEAAPRGLAPSTPPPGWGRAVVGGVPVFPESQPKFPPWSMGIVMRKVRVEPGDTPEAWDDEGGGPNTKCEGGGSIFDGSAWLLTAEAPLCQG